MTRTYDGDFTLSLFTNRQDYELGYISHVEYERMELMLARLPSFVTSGGCARCGDVHYTANARASCSMREDQ
jgi:hypothetical protein